MASYLPSADAITPPPRKSPKSTIANIWVLLERPIRNVEKTSPICLRKRHKSPGRNKTENYPFYTLRTIYPNAPPRMFTKKVLWRR